MSKKPSNARSGPGGNIPPYTDHMQQNYEFAMTKRVVRTGGVEQELTHYQVVKHKQLETAIKGSPIAQRDILRQTDLAVLSRQAAIEARCEAWTATKARHEKILEDAKAAKAPAPLVLPHPTDILINWSEGVTILGPSDETQWKRCDGLAKFRDALFMQQFMEDADNHVPMDDRPSNGAALLHGMYVNMQLPPSFRLSDAEVDARIFSLRRMTKRDALKQCRDAWQAAGRRLLRGQHYGSLQKLEPMIAAQAALVRAVRQSGVDSWDYQEALDAFTRAIRDFCGSAPKRAPKQAGAPLKEEAVA